MAGVDEDAGMGLVQTVLICNALLVFCISAVAVGIHLARASRNDGLLRSSKTRMIAVPCACCVATGSEFDIFLCIATGLEPELFSCAVEGCLIESLR